MGDMADWVNDDSPGDDSQEQTPLDAWRAVEGVVCQRCKGTGMYTPRCERCRDSTDDHVCPKPVSCGCGTATESLMFCDSTESIDRELGPEPKTDPEQLRPGAPGQAVRREGTEQTLGTDSVENAGHPHQPGVSPTRAPQAGAPGHQTECRACQYGICGVHQTAMDYVNYLLKRIAQLDPSHARLPVPNCACVTCKATMWLHEQMAADSERTRNSIHITDNGTTRHWAPDPGRTAAPVPAGDGYEVDLGPFAVAKKLRDEEAAAPMADPIRVGPPAYRDPTPEELEQLVQEKTAELKAARASREDEELPKEDHCSTCLRKHCVCRYP